MRQCTMQTVSVCVTWTRTGTWITIASMHPWHSTSQYLWFKCWCLCRNQTDKEQSVFEYHFVLRPNPGRCIVLCVVTNGRCDLSVWPLLRYETDKTQCSANNNGNKRSRRCNFIYLPNLDSNSSCCAWFPCYYFTGKQLAWALTCPSVLHALRLVHSRTNS